MRKDLLASLTSKIAVGVAAELLTAGTGGAVVFSNANHESPGPNEIANERATENQNDDHESDDSEDEATNEVESEDAESNENANNEHGKLVSEAAQDKELECDGNHGTYVSAVARGVTPCAETSSGATTESDDESAESNGKSDEDHGKSGEEHPPADAGNESSDDDD